MQHSFRSSGNRVSEKLYPFYVYLWVTKSLSTRYLQKDNKQQCNSAVKIAAEKSVWMKLKIHYRRNLSFKIHQFEVLVLALSCWPLLCCANLLKYRSACSSSKQNSVAPLSSSSLQYMLCSCTFPNSACFCCCWCSCSLFRGVSSVRGLRDDKTVFTAGLILHGVLRRWKKTPEVVKNNLPA